MDSKLPKIPDFKPSAVSASPTVVRKSSISRRAKLSIISTGLLLLLVGISFFTKEPINIAKRAFTPAASKDAAYNVSVYHLECPSPNKWVVPEAASQSCVSNDTLICGETCPPERQTDIINPEGHVCCKSSAEVPPQLPTETPPSKIPSLIPITSPVLSCSRCDFNGDGKFSQEEAQRLANCFFNPATEGCSNRDTNGDGSLGAADITWCVINCSTSATSTPTPSIPCVTPQKVSGVTISCPACSGQ